MSTAMTGSPGSYEFCVPSVWPIEFLPYLNMRPPGRWAKVHIGRLEQGVPWMLLTSGRGSQNRILSCFSFAQFLARTHHGALQICLHSFRVGSPSCTSKNEVPNHSNCDDSTAQRRRGLQKHRTSIFCIVIPQNIVHGVLPRAHNDCWWHDPVQQSSFIVLLYKKNLWFYRSY